jgi:PHD/YefM family antitoxin component YafN of YafNO toxin-antitoxin module
MPAILPIRDLKNTARISDLCRVTDAPIFITKNGYGDMVIMSMKRYEETLARLDAYDKLDVAETQAAQGRVVDATASLKKLRGRYRV